MVLQYVQDGSAVRLSARLGDEVYTGKNIASASRHDVVFRHTRPDGTVTDHRRILFDAASAIGNQAPDVGTDVYGIWLGAHVVGEPFVDIEYGRVVDEEDTSGNGLYMRAAELALQTDYGSTHLFEEQEGAFIYEDLRIIIAGAETRTIGQDTQLPSLDILANPRHVIGTEDTVAMYVAMGWADALTEGALLHQITGVPGLTAPAVFHGLIDPSPSGVLSRMEAMDKAINRLEYGGVTGEGLRISDPLSGSTAQVVKLGVDIVLRLDDVQLDLISTAADELLDPAALTGDGIVLVAGDERSWPVELLLLEQGAGIDYSPRIEHQESAQSALLTPSGTLVAGTGEYEGDAMSFWAVGRSFEATPDGEVDVLDRADWHLMTETGAVIGSGATESESPSLTDDGRHARLLVLGADPAAIGNYQSPIWLHPELAVSLRSELSTEVRIAYPRGASSFDSPTLEVFETGSMAIQVDGEVQDIRTLIGRDGDGEYSVTLALEGESRLVLALETPVSSSIVETIRTPQALRLRGRVVEQVVAPDDVDISFEVGLGQAEVYGTGRIGRAWPDGSFDLRVPGTEQATLSGSVAILLDSSHSMDDAVDPGCASDCETKRQVVQAALETVAEEVPSGVEIGVWSLASDYPGECPVAASEISSWTLSRAEIAGAGDRLYSTWGTPLTGAISSVVSELEHGTWGQTQRLIVVADGDNDCTADLGSVSVPDGLEIHTIGVGIAEGGSAELELQAISARTGGTYTRTTEGTGLAEALTYLASEPLEATLVEQVPVEIQAEGFESQDVDLPVDQDDVIVVLQPQEGRDVPKLVLVLPDDPLPELEDSATLDLIAERRAARPELVLIMPDREVDAGGWPTAFAWLEVEPATGQLSAVTQDGLHGAVVVYYGATISGMWGGLDSVMTNFDRCVLAPEGCGDDMEAITHSLCSASSPAANQAAILVSAIGTIFTSVDGYTLDSQFNLGMTMVKSMCMGHADLSGYTMGQVGAGGSAATGAVLGGAAGLGFSVLWTLLS
jgi:hypothetical protein